MAIGYLYKITSPCGLSYVGITRKEPEIRWREHLRYSRQMKTPLADAVRTHGADAMQMRVLAIVDADQLGEVEQRAIAVYDTMWPNGLNSTPGGNGVVRSIASAEARRVKKMRATMATKEYKAKQRKIQSDVWTEERKAERAESVRRLWADDDYRARMLSSRKEKQPLQLKLKLPRNHGNVCRNLWASPEIRKRILEGQARVKATPEWRANVSVKTRAHMADPANRQRIALTLSKYANVRLEKLVDIPRAKKPSRITRAWPHLPHVFTAADAMPFDWQGREFDRAIERGWLKIVA